MSEQMENFFKRLVILSLSKDLSLFFRIVLLEQIVRDPSTSSG
jgi:hypothetical protein